MPLRLRTEVALVAGAVILLEVVVYLGYFARYPHPGVRLPQHVQLRGVCLRGTTAACSIRRSGCPILERYPAVSNLQNGSYYLPIGLTALFGGYSIHAAAVLSALHVAFGAVARTWSPGDGGRVLPALLALVAWFFSIGFTANAQHLDIFRRLRVVPLAPARHLHPVAVAALVGGALAGLIVWQAILGTYPGMIVAFAHALAAWVIVQVLLFRPKLLDFLVPLAAAGVGGVLMTLLRFIPAPAERGVRPFESAGPVDVRCGPSRNAAVPTASAELAEAMMPPQPWFIGGAVLHSCCS